MPSTPIRVSEAVRQLRQCLVHLPGGGHDATEYTAERTSGSRNRSSATFARNPSACPLRSSALVRSATAAITDQSRGLQVNFTSLMSMLIINMSKMG
jgi:hypothetical protein